MKIRKIKKQKDEAALPLGKVVKNLAFAINELFRFSPLFIAVVFILELLSYCIGIIESTYYVKWLVHSIEQQKPFEKIALGILIFVLTEMVVYSLNWINYGYYRSITERRFSQFFNKKIFKKAGNVELSCYEDAEFYDKYTRASDNITMKLVNVSYNIIYIVCDTFGIITLLAVMISVDRGIALFLIFPIIANFLFGKILNEIEQKRYKEMTKANRVIDYVMRVLHLGQYAKEMRLTDIYSLMQNKHTKAVDDVCGTYDKYAFKAGTVYWVKVQFMFTFIFEGILTYCAYRALVGGTMDLAEMTIMTSIMSSVSYGVMGLFENIMSLHNEAVYIQNARDFLTYKEKIPEDQKGIKAPENIETIEFKNVSFSYKGRTEKSLDGVSITFSKNKTTALVGVNGAGKSTLVKLLLRLYDPDSGEILLNGRNIKEYELSSYRKLFSAAFQDYQIIAVSVLDNIVMGCNIENAEEKAKDVLRRVGLYDKVASLDKGIHTMMTREFDDEGAVFSGGEGQKLAVARALVKNAECMVFDEPSSALDPIAEYDLFKNIMEDTKGKCAVVISHRLSSVKAADEIIMLDGGKVIEVGDHDTLMKQNGAYSDMFRHQAYSYLAISDKGGDR